MNILYLHGLESKLSLPKKEILEKYGTVAAPDMDYFANPKMIEWLINEYQNKEIDVIIGSSMGGFAGYYVAMVLNCKALLFNPALARRSTFQEIPNRQIPKSGSNFQIVMGFEDTVVPMKETLEFLKENAFKTTFYNLKLIPNLEHQIPIDVFENQIDAFFDNGTSK